MEEYSGDWCHSPVQILVVFKLCCKTVTLRWVRNDTVSWPTLVPDAHQPQLRMVIPMTIRDLISYEDAQGMMQEALRDWPIPAMEVSRMIRQLLSEAQQAVESMPVGHSHLYMNVDFTATQVYGAPDDVEEDFMGENEPRMVPSDDSSIEALVEKNLVIMSTNSETCSVCLEELLEVLKVFRCLVNMFFIQIALLSGSGLAIIALSAVSRCPRRRPDLEYKMKRYSEPIIC